MLKIRFTPSYNCDFQILKPLANFIFLLHNKLYKIDFLSKLLWKISDFLFWPSHYLPFFEERDNNV